MLSTPVTRIAIRLAGDRTRLWNNILKYTILNIMNMLNIKWLDSCEVRMNEYTVEKNWYPNWKSKK